MDYQQKSTEWLKIKKSELEYELDMFTKALAIFPKNSLLGRLSLRATIKNKQKHLDNIKKELQDRGCTYDD